MLVAITAIGGISLAWGYAQVGLSQFARWIIVFSAFWLLAAWRRWRWFAYVGITVNFLAAALGLWFLDFPPGWMFGRICRSGLINVLPVPSAAAQMKNGARRIAIFSLCPGAAGLPPGEPREV
jgi:hypothetical protein